MSSLTEAITECDALSTTAYNRGLHTKASGSVIDIGPSGGSGFSDWATQSGNRERYALFKGWVYPPVNAIAETGAGQKICVGKVKKKEEGKPSSRKHYETKIPTQVMEKAADSEIEILQSHWLLDVMKNPNPVQTKWEFVYTFFANLCLTGWSYVIGGQVGTKKEPKVEFYAIPTTWVTPDHREEPFGSIVVKNPRRPGSSVTLKKGEFGFAKLPNPADPLAAISPASTQITALRIDDHIQSSRERFYHNGIFPSAIVKIGTNPHPDVPAGIRPRLTAGQRRQVYGVIRKMIGGVANYGNPAIIDGYIESIERLQMQHNEMGWEKSEEVNRKRILAAFGVHPYILGEAVSVGGYAQVNNIEKRFFGKVNTYIDLFSGVMTSFAAPMAAIEDDILIWLEKCEAIDPSLDWSKKNAARTRGDISQNEIRAELGLPPDEDHNEQIIDKGMVQGINQILGMKAQGQMELDQVIAYLEGLGLPSPLAKRLAGPKVKKPEQQQQEQQAVQGLQEAVKALRAPMLIGVDEETDRILMGV